jgi:dimethylhistidine N-methyltransferase
LFEEITRLPEYYPTRTERQIMETHAVEISHEIASGGTVIELGAGNCQKAIKLCQLIRPATFVAVDISTEFLLEAADGLRERLPTIDVRAVAADLTEEIVLPKDLARHNRLVFYPGSSIGNFDPPQALDLLMRVRQLLDDDGLLLVGVDLVKDLAVLEAAYDDHRGVTAAFNRNVLDHVNRLIDSDFVPDQWRHRAFFNTAVSRIEMHLVARTDVVVHWPGGERRFASGEHIHTENSYKYRREDFVGLLARAGFQRSTVWTDPRDWFAVILARP